MTQEAARSQCHATVPELDDFLAEPGIEDPEHGPVSLSALARQGARRRARPFSSPPEPLPEQPPWLEELRRWTQEFQQRWEKLVAEAVTAGQPPGLARYAAYLELHDEAHRSLLNHTRLEMAAIQHQQKNHVDGKNRKRPERRKHAASPPSSASGADLPDRASDPGKPDDTPF